MSGQKLIAIIGITGTQGGSVANAFLKHGGRWRIRGITRNPSSEKAKAWASNRDVELVKADQDDVESLKKAFTGAHAIFAVTDFPSNYTKVSENKEYQDRAREENKSLNELAADLEIVQGTNIAKAASDPGVLATLERFVLSTLTGIKTVSENKYPNTFQFDSKATIEKRVRESYPELAKRLSTVNLGAYQENLIDMPLVFGPHRGEDGIHHFLRLDTPGKHKAQPEVLASKDTGAFVEALVLHHPPGTDVLGASQIVTKEEYADIWGRTLGVKADVKDVSEDEYAQYIPEEFRDELLDFFKFIPEYGYTGGNPRVKTPAELGIETTPLEEFIKGQDWEKILG